MATKSDLRALLDLAEAIGLSRADLATAVGTPQTKTREIATIKVVVNTDAKAKQFGDVSIAKRKPGTDTFIPKMGVFTSQLPDLISALQAAHEQLS